MAKIKYADEVVPLLNKHFGAVFQPNHTNQTMKSDSSGARTRWTNQINKQQSLMHAIRYWRNMSEATKTNWNDFAAAFPQASRRNPALFLSGYQLFLKRNHNCFLNHGISTEFMTEPVIVSLPGPEMTFSISASDNSVDVTEPYIRNFGMLPELGQFLLIRIFPMAENSGQFFEPIEQTIEVEEVFIDGLFVSFDLSGQNKNLTFSVYLSKVVHQSTQYVGTKVRYMGCFTPKTFLALTDTPSEYDGQAGKNVVVKDDETGLEFNEGGGGGISCEDLIECPLIIQMINQTEANSEIISKEHNTSVPPINFGLLYNKFAALHEPFFTSSDDWRLILESEFFGFRTYIGGPTIGGGVLKEMGFDFWDTPNAGATNAFGFNARGGGSRSGSNGSFNNLRKAAFFMVRASFSVNISRFNLTNTFASLGFGALGFRDGASARLIKLAPGVADGVTTTYCGNNGRVYRAVCIDEIFWMSDNLAETKYRDGSPIPEITDNNDWKNDSDGAFSAYDNDFSNV